FYVTVVQPCALPICSSISRRRRRARHEPPRRLQRAEILAAPAASTVGTAPRPHGSSDGCASSTSMRCRRVRRSTCSTSSRRPRRSPSSATRPSREGTNCCAWPEQCSALAAASSRVPPKAHIEHAPPRPTGTLLRPTGTRLHSRHAPGATGTQTPLRVLLHEAPVPKEAPHLLDDRR